MGKAIAVKYERLFSFGNHQHVKYGVEMLVQDGEDPLVVIEEARAITKKAHQKASAQEIGEAIAKKARENKAKATTEAAA